MLSALLRRGSEIGAAARARAIAEGAARVRAALPGIEVMEAEDGIVLSARGIARRWIDEARLRWIGSLFR